VYAMLQPFQQVIGIELHEESARLAQKNLEKLVIVNATKCECSKYRVLCQDMRNFDFSILGSNDKTVDSIVIYLYEPLWTMTKAEAHEVYFTIISNAILNTPSTTVKEVYFVYLFAGLYGGAALPAFTEIMKQLPHTVTLEYEEQYYGLFFGYSDNMYIYKASLTALTDDDFLQRQQGLQETGTSQ
jgi:hypothetical protein